MEEFFDNLFKPNNIVGVENTKTGEICNYVVLTKNITEWDWNWDLFCNHNLSYLNFRIRYVVKLDRYGKVEDSTYFNF